ncbi:TIGR03364 family FAD-dependent oxidoreductase [Thermocoleostomius sinensis]|uniref:TIGR03364 family FAD-dependent oxidoreductase n=1 Tax=Thermocoleostomius sinensis A174 TaxID=2016057 RepID=A0A9E8ZDF3_9CYAN|nr:TIGR03364 family FAD-dependent oxidoreductase [Thermocoleostomius sinensis]WAL59817.1 TIGR03364 family FAD-dependent oxidoreductase [Thermocoleostomius sinensis A174]
MTHADVLIVGAGIVGLAHALAFAKRGQSVVVFERNPQAMGASIRNFGMVWPIGQPQGTLYNRALKSRDIWLEVSSKAGIHAQESGSLHVARRTDELAVLEEFVASHPNPTSVQLLTPAQAIEKSPAVIKDGLLGALWSATEVIVDPREAIAKLPAYLSDTYSVQFHFGTAVTAIENGTVTAGGEHWTGDRMVVCSGADFETLYPELYATSGITKVKLQMMRSVPQSHGWRLGAALCGGLTLTHYSSFAHCPSLPALKERIANETPHFPQWGIHVMMSQNAQGELIIGDSHEYGLSPDPFDRTDINQYVLEYLKGFADVPSFEIAATWHGVYAKLPGQTELILHPDEKVTIVNALGGAGMTLSFGLAEENCITAIAQQ